MQRWLRSIHTVWIRSDTETETVVIDSYRAKANTEAIPLPNSSVFSLVSLKNSHFHVKGVFALNHNILHVHWTDPCPSTTQNKA